MKGRCEDFQNLFETLPLDSIGQGEALAPGSLYRAEGTNSAGQSRTQGSPINAAMQDAKVTSMP